MILLIDDIRSHGGADITARTADAAIANLRLFEDRGFREVWFDHDLGLDEDIWDVVRFLERRIREERPIAIDTCVVHSMNPVGAQRLVQALDKADYHVIRMRPVPERTA